MIHVGTCSWTEKTLIQSGEFYPMAVRTAEGRLRYYAGNFDTVEVDSTYYAIPDMRNTSFSCLLLRLWIKGPKLLMRCIITVMAVLL
jgi:hypothetical protein